jgi:hypothetical protein
MANARGATLERVAQGAALLALCASLIAGATLFFPWHTVDRVEPRGMKAVFHFGQTFHDPPRAPLQEVWIDGTRRYVAQKEAPEEHDFVTCTGFEHLAIGGWPIVILFATALLAALASRAKTTSGSIWISLGSVLMSVVLAWLGIVVPMLRHIFETEGPIRLAERVFDAALTAAAFGLVLIAALRIALLIVRRRRTQR